METSLINSLAAGAIAGAIEASVTYPTEFVKTTLQIQSKAQNSPQTFHGPLDCVKQTLQTKGIPGLYKGLSALVLGTAAKAGIRFLSFEKFKQLLSDQNGRLSSSKRVIAGLGAGLTEGLLIVTPTETIKTKLIHDALDSHPKYNGLIHGNLLFSYHLGTRLIIKEEGLAGIYRGVSAVVLRQGANSAVRLTSYDLIKEKIVNQYYKNQLLPWYMSFAAGSTAGIITVYCTMPLDVLKTRMQSLDAKKLYRNSFHCFIRIIREDGILALWKGTTPRLGRLIFSGGIVFTVYEKVIGLLKYIS